MINLFIELAAIANGKKFVENPVSIGKHAFTYIKKLIEMNLPISEWHHRDLKKLLEILEEEGIDGISEFLRDEFPKVKIKK